MDSNRRRFIKGVAATGLAAAGLSATSTATRTVRENPTLLVGSLSDPVTRAERRDARHSVVEATDATGPAVGYATSEEPVVAYAFGLRDGVPQEFVGTASTEAEATRQRRKARAFVDEFEDRTRLHSSDDPVSIETDAQWDQLSTIYTSEDGDYGSVDYTVHSWRLDVDTGFTEIATVTEVEAEGGSGSATVPSYGKHDWDGGTVTAHSPSSFDSDDPDETWDFNVFVGANGTQHSIDWEYQTQFADIEQLYSSSEIRNKTATRWELGSIYADNSNPPVHATGSICSFASEPDDFEVVCTVSHDTKFADLFWTDRVQDSVEFDYYNFE